MSTYSTNLALELIGNGEQAGNWGQTTNTNIGTLLEQAISGYVTQTMSNVGDTTLTMTAGASATPRNMFIELTGPLTAARNLVVPSNKKLYFIYNNTTGGFAVTVKAAGLSGVSVPNGTKTVLIFNGTDIVNATSFLGSSSGVLAVANGGTGTTTPSLVQGSNITISGTWPNQTIAATGSAGGVTSFSAGSTGFTPSAATAGAVTLSGTLNVANGGTGSASGVAASIVLAGTFGSGTYTFDSSSLLRIGAASPSAVWRTYVTPVNSGTGQPAIVSDRLAYVDSSCLICNDNTSGSSSRNFIIFSNNNTAYAQIATDGTTVTYGTGSDYRLKTNVTPLTGSADKVKALKPCSYNWVRAPEIHSQGFLAHELAEVVPQAVVGKKDAVNGDGSIKSQQVDLSYVVPLLTSALQEALARIEALEAKVG